MNSERGAGQEKEKGGHRKVKTEEIRGKEDDKRTGSSVKEEQENKGEEEGVRGRKVESREQTWMRGKGKNTCGG